MENENGMMRRPRGRFSAEEKARIVGLYEESGLTRVEFCRREGLAYSIFSVGLGSGGGLEKRVLWRLRLGPLESMAVIGLDLKGEHGWKSKEDLMNRKCVCWPAL